MESLLNIEECISHEKVNALLKKYSARIDNTHEEKVREMSLLLFDTLSDRFLLTKQHRLLLEYSALLHDIGLFINKKKHNTHTRYLILKDEILDSVSIDLKLLLAILTGSHRKSIDKNIYLLPLEDQTMLLRLTALLRVADALDHTHKFNTFIEKIDQLENKFIVTVGGTNLDLIERKLQRKSVLFQEVFQLEILYIKSEL